MAYPYTTADITELEQECQYFRTYLSSASQSLMSAGLTTLWSNAKSIIYSAGSSLQNASDMWTSGYVGTITYQLKKMFTGIRTNWPTGGAAATMDDILNAMLGATFAQLQQFIGIEDAYRVALWNAPFNADFYAALARDFVSWA
jgi:hypothetical protein